MRTFESLAYVLSVAILAASCDKENIADANDNEDKKDDVAVTCQTLDATDLWDCGATLNGIATITNGDFDGSSFCFYYSTVNRSAEELKRPTADTRFGTISPSSGGSFNLTFYDLTPSTTYYYVAWVSIKGQEKLGEVKSFTTKAAVAVTGIATGVTATSAKVYGTNKHESTTAKYGIQYSLGNLSEESEYVYVSSKDTDGRFICSLTGLNRETKYFYRAFVLDDGRLSFGEQKSFTTAAPPSCPKGAVDLGLNVCWASCNIGASKPEEYGGYYQWAGTQDVTDTSINLNINSSNNNCPYHSGNDRNNGWTKYVPSGKSGYGVVDYRTVLEPADDIACVTLGGKWRMPTVEDWTELKNDCRWVWTDNYSGTGVAGRIVTSKKDGFTDKSIFLPAAGYRNGLGLFAAGTDGKYWSSSLNTDTPYGAWNMVISPCNTDNENRFYGLSVRPVSE